MKILFFTTGPDIVASSRARVYQYLPYLRNDGIETVVIPAACRRLARKVANNIKLGLIDMIYGKIFISLQITRFLLLLRFYDVIFIQKVILPVALVRLIAKINPNIVFDFDDAVFLRDEIYCGSASVKNSERGVDFLKYVSCIVISSDFLRGQLESIKCRNLHVLNTPVDINRFSVSRQDNIRGNVVIGWIGSPWTSRYINDLKSVFEALIVKYSFVRFEFIGADDFYKGLEGYNIKDWSFAREPQDLLGFDIGIMPLRDDEWCRGKAGYKLLQYMAAGVASMASPVGINKEIITDGVNGFLAKTWQDWLEKLCLLIDDAALRKRLGINGRKTAQESYSYEINALKLADILRSVAKGSSALVNGVNSGIANVPNN